MSLPLESFLYRNCVYRPIYYFARKTIWKNYDILVKNNTMSLEELREQQLLLLRTQAVNCYSNIPFYKKRFDDAGFDVFNDFSFNDFSRNVPILEKKDLRVVFDEHASSCSMQKLIKRQTSGSTGVPLVFYKDNDSVSFIDAAMHRNFSWYGLGIGDRRSHFWGSGSGVKQRVQFLVRDYLLNWRRFNCFSLSESGVYKYHSLLQKFRPQYVYGYAKCIYEFASYGLKFGLSVSFPPSIVVVTGEKIHDEHKKIISQYFNAPVAEEYGCTECGVIAFECSHGGMHIMSDMLLVEAVKNGDASGYMEEGGSIVISELRGHFFPLIRYQIGDRGTLTDQQCECGLGFPLIENIQGREDDYIICSDGTKIDAYCIEYSIKKVSKHLGTVTMVKGLQTKNFEVVIHVVGDFVDRSNWEKSFIVELRKYLKDLPISVIFLDDMPRHGNGKLKFFTSEFT